MGDQTAADCTRTSSVKTKARDMTKGPILRQLILFALPLFFGNVFQQFYSTVDSVVVGNFVSADALAAVTMTGSAVNTLVGLFMGMSTGASVVISHCFGRRDRAGLRKAVHTALFATFLLGLFMMVVGVGITPTLLRFMQTPESIVPLASVYLRIYFLGIEGLMFYNMTSAILRAVGDSKRPLLFLIITSLLNVVLDLLFVLYFQLGVAGVACATILSQFVSAFLGCLCYSGARRTMEFPSGKCGLTDAPSGKSSGLVCPLDFRWQLFRFRMCSCRAISTASGMPALRAGGHTDAWMPLSCFRFRALRLA